MLIPSGVPHSLAALLVDSALNPSEFVQCRWDRVAQAAGRGVEYEFAILRMSNLSPLEVSASSLCLLPSRKYMSEMHI